MTSAAEPGAKARPAHIVTFYSYKGGVGRTFTLANVGALLARWGHRVLCVDWDLEAPGLHVYYRVQPTGGLVDELVAFRKGQTLDWRRRVVRVPIEGGEGAVDLLPAGAGGDPYTRSVQQLVWPRLYADEELGVAIEATIAEWREAYDVVLIDSRTGLTDIGAICTAQLPDTLVILGTPNNQNSRGLRDVLAGATRARDALPFDRARLNVVPVLTRLDLRQEYESAQEWLRRWATEFEPEFATWLPRDARPLDVLSSIRVPYVAFWGLGERIVIDKADPHDPEDVGFSFASIAALLAHRLERAGDLVQGRRAYVESAKRSAPTVTPAATPRADPPRDPAVREAAEFLEWMALKWERLGRPAWLTLAQPLATEVSDLAGQVPAESPAGRYVRAARARTIALFIAIVVVGVVFTLAPSLYFANEASSRENESATLVDELANRTASLVEGCQTQIETLRDGVFETAIPAVEPLERDRVATEVRAQFDTSVSALGQSRRDDLRRVCEQGNGVAWACYSLGLIALREGSRAEALRRIHDACALHLEPACSRERELQAVRPDAGVTDPRDAGDPSPSRDGGSSMVAPIPSPERDAGVRRILSDAEIERIREDLFAPYCLKFDLRERLVSCHFVNLAECDEYRAGLGGGRAHTCIARPTSVWCARSTLVPEGFDCYPQRARCGADRRSLADCARVELTPRRRVPTGALTADETADLTRVNSQAMCLVELGTGRFARCAWADEASCEEASHGDGFGCLPNPGSLVCGRQSSPAGRGTLACYRDVRTCFLRGADPCQTVRLRPVAPRGAR